MASGNKKKLLTIPLDGEIQQTDLAYRLNVNDAVVWLPKSQIEDWETKNGTVSFWLPEWLITDKGLDIFVDTSYEPSLFD